MTALSQQSRLIKQDGSIYEQLYQTQCTQEEDYQTDSLVILEKEKENTNNTHYSTTKSRH